jgi:predicted ferric reductase
MTKETPWMDRLSFVLSVVIVLAAALYMGQHGIFSTSLTQSSNVSWYLIRSAGIMSYILLTASVVWGLALSSRVVKDWSPGILSLLMHSTISWLAVVMGIGHGLLLLVDQYFKYQVADVFIPFIGPYRPLAVGLGTLTFWISLAVAVSFALRNRLPRNTWKKIHYTSYVGFLLATAHGLLAGSDASHMGFQILLLISVVLVVVMTAYRIGRRGESASRSEKSAIRS